MSCFRVLLSIIFPPLAVLDRGCGSILIVTILTCIGWVPGVIAALVILNNNSDNNNGPQQLGGGNYYSTTNDNNPYRY